MAEPAFAIPDNVRSDPIRRFYIADLTTHGPWLLQRLLKVYPHLNERSIIGWLNGVLDLNDFLCLYQPDAVCFAERFNLDRLASKPIVREVFVWCKDPSNTEQQTQALQFYDRMADWARHQQIDKMIVAERTDVPIDMLREHFKRLNEIKTVFVRV